MIHGWMFAEYGVDMTIKFAVCVVIFAAVTTRGQAMDEELEHFLDSSISNQARAQAGQEIGFLEDPAELEKLRSFLADKGQVAELRSVALQKYGDSKPMEGFELSLTLLRDTETPKALRLASAGFIGQTAKFGNVGSEYRLAASEVMRGVLKKEEPEEIREASISYLLNLEDPQAEEILKASLMSGEGIIKQVKAVGYAASNDPRKYEAELGSILYNSQNPAVTARTIEALASNVKYQPRIKQLFLERDASLEVRIAAVDSLTKYMPQFVKEAVTVAGDENQPPALRTACLYQISGTATRFNADPALWGKFGVEKAELGSAIQKIMEFETAPEQVKDAAEKYLEMRSNE